MSDLINTQIEDHLDVDDPLPGQSYVCLSFISPENIIVNKDKFLLQEYLKSKSLTYEDYEDFVSQNQENLDNVFNKNNNFQTSCRGVKVRGVYDNEEAAKKRAATIRNSDINHDVFVAPVGYWLPWNPDKDKIQNQEYLDSSLNTLMKKYKEQEQLKNQHYAQQIAERKKIAAEEGQMGRKLFEESLNV